MGQSLRISLSAIVAIAALLWSSDASAQGVHGGWEDGYAPGFEASKPSPEDPSEDELPRVRGADLRRDVRDIVVAPWPPPLRLTLGFGAHYPFQVIGGGLEIEGYLSSWLRLSAVYYAGVNWATDDPDPIFSNYAEALVGVRLLFVESERSVDVRVDDADGKPRRPFGSPAPNSRLVLRAWLPSYHAVLVEVGALTGLAVHLDCGAGCPPDVDPSTLPVDERQLVYLLAGFRYVYFVHASSARQPGVNRRILFQAAIHAIAPPWGTTEKVLLWRDGDRVERVPFGGRLVLRIPFRLWKPGAIQLGVGYLPMPASVLFSGGVEF